MTTQPALLDVVATHCFFGCREVVRDPDPERAHDRMERHYDEAHRADLDRTIGALS